MPTPSSIPRKAAPLSARPPLEKQAPTLRLVPTIHDPQLLHSYWMTLCECGVQIPKHRATCPGCET